MKYHSGCKTDIPNVKTHSSHHDIEIELKTSILFPKNLQSCLAVVCAAAISVLQQVSLLLRSPLPQLFSSSVRCCNQGTAAGVTTATVPLTTVV